MPSDETQDRSPSERVDVCIVGSGVAGGIVADRLAAEGFDVVVLEAGERFPEPGDRFEQQERALRPSHTLPEVWNVGGERDEYVSSGPIDYPLNRKRVKGVGGTTLHWGGLSPRLRPKDFEMATRYGLASDWPISYETLRPYYLTAERELGVAGAGDNPFLKREGKYPLPPFPPSPTDQLYAEACAELGYAIHTLPQARNTEPHGDRPQCLGYGTCSPVCPIGAKYSGDAHVRSAESEGARVIDRAPVQRLEHDSDGETVEAAVYATPDGTEYRQEARQFVVACGGVETARLLLLSRSNAYPDGLANSSGLVGRYFMDHPYVTTVGVVDEPGNPDPFGYPTSQSQEFYDHDDPTPGSVMITFRNVPPVEVVSSGLRGGDDLEGEMLDPLTGDIWGDSLIDRMQQDGSDLTTLKVDAAVELLPRTTNSVTLDPTTTDDHGNPVPDVSIGIGPHAEATLEHAVSVQKRIIREAGGTVTDTNIDNTTFGGHHMGTTRMGTDPAESVVDPRLRTHDLANLSVVSSSVFVTGGAVNPTLTIAALALRAADHLRADL
jgi:choline dehydrogenase-like flavoprotein